MEVTPTKSGEGIAKEDSFDSTPQDEDFARVSLLTMRAYCCVEILPCQD